MSLNYLADWREDIEMQAMVGMDMIMAMRGNKNE
jgi:hypothetical protein